MYIIKKFLLHGVLILKINMILNGLLVNYKLMIALIYQLFNYTLNDIVIVKIVS